MNATPSARVHVAVCVDKGFVVPLAALLASVASSPCSDVVTVHVVHSDIDEATRGQVLSGAAGLDVVWREVDASDLAGAHVTDFLTAATLYRLLLGHVLPAEVTRVVYLDADTIVVGALDELFHLDLQGAVVGAIRDAASPWAAGVYGADWRALGVDPGSPYFNAGVLVIDLDAWRRQGSGEAALGVLRSVKARWGDQDALNKVFEGAWTPLPARWNVQTADVLRDSFGWALWRGDVEEAVANPGVIHYTTRDKPWVPGSTHPEAERWFEALDRTHWKDWRPRPPVEEHTGLALQLAKGVRSVRAWRLERRSRLPR